MKLSDVDASSISGLCCSPAGLLFLLDSGLSAIYRLDLSTGDCATIARLESAIDLSFFGVFVVVLLQNGILLLDPEGNVLKKHTVVFPSQPVAVCTTFASIIVICENAAICSYKIDLL